MSQMECALFNELSVLNTKDTSFHLHSKCFSWTLGRNKMLEAAFHFKEIYKEHLTTFYLLNFLILFFLFVL